MATTNNIQLTIKPKSKKDVFMSIFQLLKNSTSTITAIFEPTHLHIQGMDKSHVCLFNLQLYANWFDEYCVPVKQEISFDSTIFHSIISTKCDDHHLIIKHNNESRDSLLIELLSDSEKPTNYNKYFTMPLIDEEYEELGIPNIEFEAEVTLPSKNATDMLSQLSNFGDDIVVKCSAECVDFISKGSSGEMRVNIPVDDMVSYSVVEDDIVMLTYSLTYLNKLCITNKLTPNIELYLSNDNPMKIVYNLSEESILAFYIAPKALD